MPINAPEHDTTGSQKMPDLSVEVKPGDNIWTLSEQIYGKGIHPLAAIYEENHLPVVVRENLGKRSFTAPAIRPGQMLLFPSPERIPELQKEFFSHLQPGATKYGGQPDTVSIPQQRAKTAKDPSDVVAAGPGHHAAGAPKIDQTPLTKDNGPAKDNAPAKTNGAAKGEGDSKQPEKPQLSSQQPDLATRIGHVGEVLADGLIVGTAREGIKQSCEDPLGTLARAGTAVALGAAFGIATGGVGFVAEAAGAAAIGLTVAGAWDFLNPFDKKNIERNDNIRKNLQTAWDAPKGTRMDKCDLAMEKELGRPGFDLALGTLGGFAGAKFARPFVPAPEVIPPPKPSGTSLIQLVPSTEVTARPLPTTIVPRELFSDLAQHQDIVDAESIKELPGPGTDGAPKQLEDFSLRANRTAAGGGKDSLTAIEAVKAESVSDAATAGLARIRDAIKAQGGDMRETKDQFAAYFEQHQVDRLRGLSRLLRQNGIPFETPKSPYAGWKIHLAVEDNKYNALTQAVAEHLVQNKSTFKIGLGGTTEDGKGMTIYLGDRDTMLAEARDLERKFGSLLPKIPLDSDAAYDDELIGNTGAIGARFDISNKGFAMQDWHQYGYRGIPFQNRYMCPFQTFRTELKELPPDHQALKLDEVQADMRKQLTDKYGAFFAGTYFPGATAHFQ
jgi:hypothetical protein